MAKPEIALAQGGPPMQPPWVTTLVRSGTVTTPTGNQDWNTPPYFSASGNGSFSNPGTYTVSSSGTFTFTLKWKNLDGSAGANPPKYVNLRISASASAAYDNRSDMGFQVTGSGTADNGRGASAVALSPGPGMVSSSVEYVTQDGSSGTVTITITENATSTITVGAGNTQACHALVSCGATVDILNHAHPVNFRKDSNWRTVDIQAIPLELKFKYLWDSTGGSKMPTSLSLPDLTSCTWYEYVTYFGDGSPGHDRNGDDVFIPNSPPFSPIPIIAPTILGGNASDGGLTDRNWAYSPVPAYSHASYTAHQVFLFKCSQCMTPTQFQPLGGPYDIIRDVSHDLLNVFTWYFTVTKDGYQSKSFLP